MWCSPNLYYHSELSSGRMRWVCVFSRLVPRSWHCSINSSTWSWPQRRTIARTMTAGTTWRCWSTSRSLYSSLSRNALLKRFHLFCVLSLNIFKLVIGIMIVVIILFQKKGHIYLFLMTSVKMHQFSYFSLLSLEMIYGGSLK